MNKTLSSAIVAGILALSASASLQAADKPAPVEHRSAAERFVDDAAITAAIKARHAEDDAVHAFSIGVETVNGEVQLSGFTPSAKEKARAEEIAKGVDGVRAVRNDIIVRTAAN
jgi:osmotically-inducible protein OsmY